jgi:tetratricopeptide (TPR) repeat protein
MLLDQAGLPCRILATDINNTALRKARAGRYEARHVQRLPRELHNRYFEPAGTDCVRVVRDIRDRVQFERHNLLVDEGTPSGWTPLDAVLCRNVLIFFECDAALDIVERLARACRPGGYLLLGAVERPLLGLSSLAERSESSDLICVPGGSVPDISPIARRSSGSLRGGGAVVRLQSPRSAPPDETLDARMDEASSLQKRGRLEEALAIVDAAASRAPLSAPVHTVRGVLLKDLGRYGDAIRAFRAACFYDGNAWLAPYELGVCLETQGDAREAYEAYRHALGVLENDGLPGLHDAWGDVAELASTVREICRAHLRRYRELFGL